MAGIISSIFSSSNNNKTFKVQHLTAVTVLSFSCQAHFFVALFSLSIFQPLKTHEKNTKRHYLHQYAKATLGSGNMKSAVVLPKGEDINEWLAVNSVFFRSVFCEIHHACLLFFSPLLQLSTSSMRSACCMAPLLSSAHHSRVLR